jgi:hypothetical protein
MRYTFLLKISFFITLFVTLYVLVFSTIGKSIIESNIESTLQSYLKDDFQIRNFQFNQDELSFSVFIHNKETLRVKGYLSVILLSFSGKYYINNFDINYINKNKKNLYFKGKGDFDISPFGKEIFADLKTNKNESMIFSIKNSGFSDDYYLNWQLQEVRFSTISSILNNFSLNFLNNYILGKVTSDGKATASITSNNFRLLSSSGKHVIEGGFSKKFFYSMLFDSSMSPYKIPFLLNLDTEFENNDLILKLDFINEIISFKVNKAIYNIQNYDILSDLSINFNDLKQLKPFIGIDLIDSLDINGTLKKEMKNFYIFDAKSKRLKGDIRVAHQNNKLEIKFKSILFEKILTLFRQYPYIHGETDIHLLHNFTYNILEFKGNIKDASIESNFILHQLDKIFNKNISRTIYKSIRFKGYLRENKIIFSVVMDTKDKDHFVFKNIIINLDRNYIFAPFKMKIKNYGNLALLLKGDLRNPKIELDVTEKNREIVKKFIINESQTIEESNLIEELLNIL